MVNTFLLDLFNFKLHSFFSHYFAANCWSVEFQHPSVRLLLPETVSVSGVIMVLATNQSRERLVQLKRLQILF